MLHQRGLPVQQLRRSALLPIFDEVFKSKIVEFTFPRMVVLMSASKLEESIENLDRAIRNPSGFYLPSYLRAFAEAVREKCVCPFPHVKGVYCGCSCHPDEKPPETEASMPIKHPCGCQQCFEHAQLITKSPAPTCECFRCWEHRHYPATDSPPREEKKECKHMECCGRCQPRAHDCECHKPSDLPAEVREQVEIICRNQRCMSPTEMRTMLDDLVKLCLSVRKP